MYWRLLRRGAALFNPILRHAQELAVVALLLILLVMNISTVWIDWAMAERESAVAADVARIQGERDRLAVAVLQAADPAFLPVRARDVLHYAMPGEQLVLLIDSAPAAEPAPAPWWLYE